MTTQRTEYALQVQNGKTLILPPWEAGQDRRANLELPDVYAIGTKQLYPTGTIYRHGLRTFIYSKTQATNYGTAGGAIGAGYGMESASESLALPNSIISGAAGAYTVRLTRPSTAVDQFAGGFLGIKMGTGGMGTAGRYSSRQIISNTVQDGSDIVTFTLDGTNAIALTPADDAVLTTHPYAECRSIQTSIPYGMTIGILCCTSVASSYLWLQTGGPNNIIPTLITFEGTNGYEAPVYICAGVPQRADGSSTTVGAVEAGNLQCIGYAYASSDIGGPAGTKTADTIASAIFLTIFN